MKIRGQAVKVIQEYKDFIVVEFPAGYRECISKFELKKEIEKAIK